ncbi:hypothetical protein IAT38_006447 [Cryptococcus sp. DSM 104549]
MSACPVCGETQNADEQAFAHHVNSHFGDGDATDVGHSLPPDSRKESSVQPGLGGTSESSHGLDACPICNFPLAYLTAVESQTHLNSCLDGPAPQQSSSSHSQSSSSTSRPTIDPNDPRLYELDPSDAAGADIDFDYTVDLEAQRRADNEWVVDEDWDGPAKPSGWSDWVGKPVAKGDRWWDPVEGSVKGNDLPNNISPGVIHVLAATLRSTAQRGVTRRAVLCRDTVHLKGAWNFDLGWGCGYRNALMALTALLSVPAYQLLFSRQANGADPGVRRIQGWIEEAWAQGYDAEGKKQLGGKVLGRRKWIGPSDLYSMFTYMGVPCDIYDFPKAKDAAEGSKKTHSRLQQWVKAYFSNDLPVKKSSSDNNAYDVIMRSGQNGSGRGDAVRVSDKFPLILQHSGHSRTIVGYEENSRGDINLLLFDPGRSVPKDIRNAGIAHVISQRANSPPQHATIPAPMPISSYPSHPEPAPRLRKTSTQSYHSTHEPLQFSRPFTNGRAEVVQCDTPEELSGPEPHLRGGSVIRAGSSGKRVTADVPLEEDEEMTPSGWVRKKVSKARASHAGQRTVGASGSGPAPDPTSAGSAVKTLNYFRVNLGKLSKHTQYQVLAFTGGPILTEEERERRKVVRGKTIRD